MPIQHINLKKKKQALQKPVPEKLGKLIELVSGVPPDAAPWLIMLQIFDLLDWTNVTIVADDETRNAMAKIFCKNVEKLSGQAKEFVGALDLETSDTLFVNNPLSLRYQYEKTMAAARDRYEFLIIARKALHAIATLPNTIGLSIEQMKRGWNKELGMIQSTDLGLLSTLVRIGVTREFRVVVFANNPLNFLVEALEGVEADRIRECPICTSIFWAGRIDQKCCSKQCGQTSRVRRWREKYQEKYKQQRYQKAEEQERQDKKSKIGRK